MSVTQKDIAERAQVSRSLVGRVLNGDDSIRVSSSKRQHILNTAREAGYQPNLIARNLRRGKSHAVVVICEYDENGPNNDPANSVLETLAADLAQVGYELKVRAFQNISDIMAGVEETASTSACDAFVVWLGNEHGELPGIAIEKRGLPFVILGHYDDTHPDWCQVDFDHALMMHQAVQSLVSMGHTRLAYIGFDNDYNYAHRLRSGFLAAALEMTGSHVPEQWISRVNNDHTVTEAIVEQWLEMPPDQQPTGVVIGAGLSAWIGIEVALARRGRRIGAGDLAVVGQRPGAHPLLYGQAQAFDNIDMSLLAKAAAEVLKQQISGQDHSEKKTRLLPALMPVNSLCLPLPVTIPEN